jgi:hypothetical protein
LEGILDSLVHTSKNSSGRHAEIVILKMQELSEGADLPPPTFASFKKVINCWSKSPEEGAALRAENLIVLAENLYNAGDTEMRPDMDGYTTVIMAWARASSQSAPDMIQRHLVEIKKRRSEGDPTFKLNDRIFAALITAYANSGREDAARMASTIFDATPYDMRTTAVYNALIEAQGGDAKKAEELLQIMHHSYVEGNQMLKPDVNTFNAVLQAWLRSGSPMTAWRADGMFKRMQVLTSGGQLDVKPNSKTFDLVISALAQDWGVELGKLDMYLRLLKEHYQAGGEEYAPTTYAYTEAIKAWCRKDDDPRAFLRAKALLDEMHGLAREGVDSVKPDRYTFEVYLKALSQSSVEARKDLAKDVLRKMIESNIDFDPTIRWCLQRCFLPSTSFPSWVVRMDEPLTPQDNWIDD